MASYFAGIDGGQSGTSAVIGDESGRILGRGDAGPADEVGESAASTRLRDALGGALFDAIRNAGLPEDTRFERIVAGVSGYEGRVYGQPVQLPADSIELVHDTENAHAGALGGTPGVIVIAGTGSVAFGLSERGTRALVGGWGYLFGDEGGAFRLVRDLITDAMRASDEGRSVDLAEQALAHFQQPTLRKLCRAFYSGSITRAQFAAFAGSIVEQAARGDEAAARYVESAATALVRLARLATERCSMDSARIAFIGGMTRSDYMQAQIGKRFRETIPQAQHVAAEYEPDVGALLLAYKSSGVRITRVA